MDPAVRSLTWNRKAVQKLSLYLLNTVHYLQFILKLVHGVSSHLLDLGLVDEGTVEAQDLLVLLEPQRGRLRGCHGATIRIT